MPPLKQPVDEGTPGKSQETKFDAKAYLERTLPREPGDRLKVFKMNGRDAFRVNWYSSHASQTAPAASVGPYVVHIRDSKFLYCRLNEQGEPQITYAEKQ